MRRVKQIMAVAAIALTVAACAPTSYDEELYDPSESSSMQNTDAYSAAAGDKAAIRGRAQASNQANAKVHNDTYYFDYDKSEIQGRYRDAVNAQARYLLAHPNARILLAGNTDARGSREYNIALGERRAVYVKDVLLLNGVAEEQIRVVSYGEEKPAILGDTPKAYRLNRRVRMAYEVTG